MLYAGDEYYGDDVTSGLLPEPVRRPVARKENAVSNYTYQHDPRISGADFESDSEVPGLEELEEWLESGEAEATDGCIVEPDGTCEHGCKSWLVELCMI